MEPEHKTILLVEDDQSIRELYALALTKLGFTIHTAKNGEEGVALALSHHPDLILLDIDLPLLDGYHVAEKIRSDEWGKTALIMFLTNHSELSYEAHASLQEPIQYIVKAETPVKEVVAQIKKLLS